MFGLHGITGNFIAVALLLSIVGGLGTWAVMVQAEVANKPYSVNGAKTIEDTFNELKNVKVNSTENTKYDITNN
jgi:hypothetical protein